MSIMKMGSSVIAACLISTPLLPLAASAQGEGVVALWPVPKSLTDAQRRDLDADYSRLAPRRERYLQDGLKFLSDCNVTQPPADCGGRQATLLTRQEAFNTDARAYNARAVARLEARVGELKAALTRDTNAIKNLHVHNNDADFEAWMKFAEDAAELRQHQIEEAGKDFAMTVALGSVQKALEVAVLARPLPKIMKVPTAQKIIRDLKASNVEDPVLFSGLLSLASPNDKTRIAGSVDVLRRLAGLKGLWDLSDAGPDYASRKWTAASVALAFLAPDPRMLILGSLTLNEIRVVTYTVSTMAQERWAEYQMGNLTELSEQQLVDLKNLSTRLNKTGNALRVAKAELAAMR